MAGVKRNKRRHYSKPKNEQSLIIRRIFAVILIVLFVVVALFGLCRLFTYTGTLLFSNNPQFQIKSIELNSDGRLTSSRLMEYAKIDASGNLFDLDLKSVRKKLESVPLIESVTIQRVLPDKLVINVSERVGVAQVRWARGAMPLLLDSSGIVLPATRTGASLPVIEWPTSERLRPGEHIDDPGVSYVLDLIHVADELGLGSQIQFKSFNLFYPDFIRVELDGGVSAQFPRHSARDKLLRLVRVLQIAQEQGRRIRTVDLVPDGSNVPTTYQ